MIELECNNRTCPYLYLKTGKCELNPMFDFDACPSEKKRKELFELGQKWRSNKKCILSNCDAEHEGICTLDLYECTAQSDKDLMTEEEYDSMNGVKGD